MTSVRSITEPRIQPGWSTPDGDNAAAFEPAGPKRVGRRAVLWDKLVNFLLPVGYEDETGFHYGEPSAWSDGVNPTS